MSKPPTPQRATIGGEEVVILPVADYERLATARRQLGAREARVRRMNDQMHALTELVTDIQRILVDTPPCCETHRGIDRKIGQLMNQQRPHTRSTPRPPTTP
ncbi:hypothetical protein [Plantactinospora sp. WMMB782]|uniref:hypothetical protein n=1 Tax=Plantactinospora sp. WMMB782 TaxID=3404121 RepID=UPI003B95A138